MKIEERNEKSNSIRRQENSWQHRLMSWASSVFFGMYAVVARSIVDALRPWKRRNKCYLSPSFFFSRKRGFLLTCITKFSRVSIWTNTGETIHSIFTGTAIVASDTDTIIDVWKQTTHKNLAQLKKLGWVRITSVNDVKARHHLDGKQSWSSPTRL